MPLDSTTNAIDEIRFVKSECLSFLKTLREFSPPDLNGRFPDTFRLIAIPMLYSIWERCFTLCHAVGFRLVRNMSVSHEVLGASERAAWLIKAPFYQSFSTLTRNQGTANPDDRNKTSQGSFDNLSKFISEYDKWVRAPLDQNIDTDDLVMTASNVNKDIVLLNARALGIADYEPFMQLKLDHLKELVGRRNAVGHGATLEGPTEPEFARLWQFTEDLIATYCDTFISYFEKRFSTTPPPPTGT